MTEIRVLTWNIRHGLTENNGVDIGAFIKELPRFNADIIILQEVDRLAKRSGSIDQYMEFKQHLGHQWFGSWTKRCSLGWTGSYGLATFSRYPILQTRHHLLSGEFHEKCYAQESMLEAHSSLISVFNIHMPFEGHTGAKHTDTAWKTLNELSLPENCIVGGDFNVFETSAEAEILLRECVDIGIRKTHPMGRIDYCMGRGRLVPEKQEVYDSNLSDHFPFVTTFLLKPFSTD
jgi:endonuclease/exonuclease/phosphatase family metal-dependent hydrolase